MSNNSVLVPLDGSDFSERALAIADSLLKGKPNGKLTILRALETPKLSAWLPAEMIPLHRQERDLVKAYLAEKEKEWKGNGYDVATVLADGPGAVEAIITECADKRTELVVMSSHGRSGWLEFFLGSTTEKVMRLCPAQVYVVKNNSKAPSMEAPKSILVPLDGSKRAEKALPEALELAKGGASQVTLIGVSVIFQGHAFESDRKNVIEPDMKRIQNYLNGQAEWLRNQGLDVDVVVRRGQAAEQILEYAKSVQTELILMTSKGQSGVAVWLFGSVAERVIRYSECSTLVLKELSRNKAT